MKNNKVPIIVMMSTNMFVDKLEDIRGICKQCKAKEVLDDAVDIILFYFNDNELWIRAKQKIQLLVVGRINFKLSPKRVIIMEEMKNIIVEPPQPPAWFLEFEKRFLKFQTEMLKFQEMVMARFDKQDEFNKYVIARLDYMDTHQPTWFKQWVKTDFNPLKHRIDNIVKLNNLKE